MVSGLLGRAGPRRKNNPIRCKSNPTAEGKKALAQIESRLH
jgi:hypothetical protein